MPKLKTEVAQAIYAAIQEANWTLKPEVKEALEDLIDSHDITLEANDFTMSKNEVESVAELHVAIGQANSKYDDLDEDVDDDGEAEIRSLGKGLIDDDEGDD